MRGRRISGLLVASRFPLVSPYGALHVKDRVTKIGNGIACDASNCRFALARGPSISCGTQSITPAMGSCGLGIVDFGTRGFCVCNGAKGTRALHRRTGVLTTLGRTGTSVCTVYRMRRKSFAISCLYESLGGTLKRRQCT